MISIRRPQRNRYSWMILGSVIPLQWKQPDKLKLTSNCLNQWVHHNTRTTLGQFYTPINRSSHGDWWGRDGDNSARTSISMQAPSRASWERNTSPTALER